MAGGDPEAAHGDQREQAQHDERADQPELLADQREDEIGVRLGQEEHLLLALPEPDAAEAAGAEGDERLHELKAGVLRVRPRIEEGEQAPHAIGRQLHGQRHRQRAPRRAAPAGAPGARRRRRASAGAARRR